MAVNTRIQIRRGTTTQWTNSANDPGKGILYIGELGLDTTTKKFKIGDGTTHWTGLPYAGGSQLLAGTGIGLELDDANNAYTIYSLITGVAGQQGITFSTFNMSEIKPTISGTGYRIGLSTKLENIHDLAGTGFIIQNGDTLYARTITGGDNINVSNGNGVNDNPTIALNHTISLTGTIFSSGSITSSGNIKFNGNLLDSQGQELNTIINKLIPPKPPAFPSTQSLSFSPSQSSHRLCSSFTPATNNNNVSVSAGNSITTLMTSTYTTNSISNVGFNPSNTGTLSVIKNGTSVGTKNFVELTSSINNTGNFGDLRITSNADAFSFYPSINSGFWQIFTTNATGLLSSGWNVISISGGPPLDRAVSVTGYYDLNSVNLGVPILSGPSLVTGVGGALIYSSSVPHYSGSVTIRFSGQKLSGDTYPAAIANNVGATSALPGTSLNRVALGLPDILPQNAATSATGLTYNAVLSPNFASISSGNVGPTIILINSAGSSSSLSITPTTNYLIKNLSGKISTILQEDNIPSTLGDNYAYRISGYNYGDNPTVGVTGVWNSLATLSSGDAALVGGIISHNVINYSSGYTPVGPNLGANSRSTDVPQYFTLRVHANSSVSKIKIAIGSTTGIAGLWLRLPKNPSANSAGTNYEWNTLLNSTNGWIAANMGTDTALFSSTSFGAADGAFVPLNTPLNSNTSYTMSFRIFSSDTIDIRFRLNSPQSINYILISSTT